jgi:hypothetical protein
MRPKNRMIIIMHFDTNANGPAAFWKMMLAMEDQI